jgi:hypothetical protein
MGVQATSNGRNTAVHGGSTAMPPREGDPIGEFASDSGRQSFPKLRPLWSKPYDGLNYSFEITTPKFYSVCDQPCSGHRGYDSNIEPAESNETI